MEEAVSGIIAATLGLSLGLVVLLVVLGLDYLWRGGKRS